LNTFSTPQTQQHKRHSRNETKNHFFSPPKTGAEQLSGEILSIDAPPSWWQTSSEHNPFPPPRTKATQAFLLSFTPENFAVHLSRIFRAPRFSDLRQHVSKPLRWPVPLSLFLFPSREFKDHASPLRKRSSGLTFASFFLCVGDECDDVFPSPSLRKVKAAVFSSSRAELRVRFSCPFGIQIDEKYFSLSSRK